MFYSLLENKQIHYYSNDNMDTVYNCFPKPILVNRFINMMEERHFIQASQKTQRDVKDYYLLSDNDMIYGPGFCDYFLSAMRFIESKKNNIHFLVKHPGGVPSAAQTIATDLKLNNLFKQNEQFRIVCAIHGGGSGCWFMNYNMLINIKWNLSDILKVYGKFKGHDTTSWNIIKEKQPNIPYVCAVEIPNEKTNPAVLHLGPKYGSICNSLAANKYNEEKAHILNSESILENMSISDILKTHNEFIKW
jgi:hypothetical protein